jgi:DNA-binding response OmpR family regulator
MILSPTEGLTEFNPSQFWILVVEDYPDTLNLAKQVLERKGFNVLQASTGQQGIDLAYENDVDLVLLDIKLPDIIGFDVCSRIKGMDKVKIPIVIFFTVLSLNADRQRALEAGGDDYLEKHLNGDDLVSFIKKWLDPDG